MIALPAERGQDRVVQAVEAGVAVNQQPPPDRRLGHPPQLRLDLHDDVGATASIPRHWIGILRLVHRLSSPCC
jgi:hypothetical protein